MKFFWHPLQQLSAIVVLLIRERSPKRNTQVSAERDAGTLALQNWVIGRDPKAVREMCSRDWLKLAPVRRWLMQRQRNFAGLGVALIELWRQWRPIQR